MQKDSQQTTAIHQYLKSFIYKKQPTHTINLEFKSIKDLLPYLHHFQKLKHLKKLSLHGNKIKQLPTDLADVFPSLQEIDLTNNPLHQNIELLLISLKTLKNLKHLRCFIRKQDQYKIGRQLKNLQFINNTKIYRKKAKQVFQFKNANHVALQQFQQHVMDHFRSLLHYQTKYLGGHVQQFHQRKFRQQIHEISQQCIDVLTSNQDRATNNIQFTYLFTAKFHIFQILRNHVANLCSDIYDDLGKFVKQIFQQQGSIFSSMSQLAINLTKFQLQSKQKQYKQIYQNAFHKQNAIIHRNTIMQNEIKRMLKQKQQLISENSRLQNNNKKMMNLIYQFAQGTITNQRQALRSIQPIINNTKNKDKSMIKADSKSNIKIQNRIDQNYNTYNDQKKNYKVSQFKQLSQNKQQNSKESPITKKSNLKSIKKAVSTSKQSNNSNTHNRSSTYHNINYSNSKILTLNQLKQTINEIYQSKIKYDQKNYKFKMPRLTMQKYFHLFLQQKYGLKALSLEAANNLVQGIRNYIEIDNDIKVFHLIFKNQVDQQFHLVQEDIKATIHKLLKKHLQAKNPYKSIVETNELINRKIHGDISYQQCEDLIKYLYDEIDANQLLTVMNILFKERTNKQMQLYIQSQSSKKKSYYESYNTVSPQPITINQSKKLQYSIFQKQILNFQLQKHQKLLKPILVIFKNNDKNNDGIIDQEQFIKIISLMTSSHDQTDIIANLLQIVDPFNHRSITFTQIIKLTANYPQNNPLLYRLGNNISQDQYFNMNV